MAFAKKEWKGRIVEFPGRRRLKGTGITDVYDIARNEGAITQEGDAFSAANMNDLEGRIEGGLLEKVNKSDVLQTLEQVSANTDSNKIAGANALRELNNKMLIKTNSIAIACYFGKVDAHDRVYSASHYYPYGVISAKVTGVEIPWVKFLSSTEVAKIQVITSGNYFYFQCDDSGVVAQIGNKTCVVTMKIS